MSIFRRAAVRDLTPDTVSETSRELVASMHYEVMPTDKVDNQIALLPPHRTVSVTCSPKKGIDATIEVSSRVQAVGHTPIPHIAARMVESSAHFDRICTWIRENGIRQAFVIGGDAELDATRPYPSATALIADLCRAGAGLERIGSAGYPDGHAAIPGEVLRSELQLRQGLLNDAGINGWLSTQMCFDADLVLSWLEATRNDGITLPVHLGIPGALDTTKLLTMGVRLGIGASLRYLSKNKSSVSRLVGPGGYDPMELLSAVSPSAEELGIEALHVFTFNQVAATNAWREKVMAS
jgi:methylenetetrahydrofolate reductase (NADPH)